MNNEPKNVLDKKNEPKNVKTKQKYYKCTHVKKLVETPLLVLICVNFHKPDRYVICKI